MAAQLLMFAKHSWQLSLGGFFPQKEQLLLRILRNLSVQNQLQNYSFNIKGKSYT